MFTDKLLQEENIDNNFKYILLDQATPPISSSKYSRYFTNPKTIIVDRDPRDLYVLNKALWGVGYIPSLTVEQFISWYATTRKTRENELQHIDSLLFLTFESLIYDYDASLNKIYNFINLPEQYHINKLKVFNPDLSIKNTQIFLQYPDLSSDINEIEKHLEKHCFAFPQDFKTVPKKHFLIQTINNEVELVQYKGSFPSECRKYIPYILYRLTHLYATSSFFIRESKRRKGISLIKLLIKSSVKIIFSFIVFPIDLFKSLLLYLISCIFGS
jgi:hypothetical protein